MFVGGISGQVFDDGSVDKGNGVSRLFVIGCDGYVGCGDVIVDFIGGGGYIFGIFQVDGFHVVIGVE